MKTFLVGNRFNAGSNHVLVQADCYRNNGGSIEFYIHDELVASVHFSPGDYVIVQEAASASAA